MRIATAIAFRGLRDAGELPVTQYPVGDAQPAHEGVLRRRGIKEPVKTPAEVVDALGKLSGGGFGLQPRVGVEGMLVALGLLLGDELLAVGLEAGHGREVRGVRTYGL